MIEVSEALCKRIIWYLTNYPSLRDKYMKLLAMIWRDDIGEKNHKKSNFSILGNIFNEEVTNPESVRRSWQKVLEENPTLRGPQYQMRHKIREPQVREQIKKI